MICLPENPSKQVLSIGCQVGVFLFEQIYCFWLHKHTSVNTKLSGRQKSRELGRCTLKLRRLIKLNNTHCAIENSEAVDRQIFWIITKCSQQYIWGLGIKAGKQTLKEKKIETSFGHQSIFAFLKIANWICSSAILTTQAVQSILTCEKNKLILGGFPRQFILGMSKFFQLNFSHCVALWEHSI